MIGVNFQPGMSGDQPGQPPRQPGGGGVQEAIKILSLRLPKVVGAQAAAPQALLTAPGSGGSRVDSVVNQVLSRIMPTGQPPQPPQANLGSMPGPSFSGDAAPQYQPPQAPMARGPQRQAPSVTYAPPRVTMEAPWADVGGMLGAPPSQGAALGRPSMDSGDIPPAMIGTLPSPDPFATLQHLFRSFTEPPPPRDRPYEI